MAETLFAGRCVDGDIALCEAALSTQYFLKLVELGVPFPRNRYGEYIGDILEEPGDDEIHVNVHIGQADPEHEAMAVAGALGL